jgi:hypothetical protein
MVDKKSKKYVCDFLGIDERGDQVRLFQSAQMILKRIICLYICCFSADSLHYLNPTGNKQYKALKTSGQLHSVQEHSRALTANQRS